MMQGPFNIVFKVTVFHSYFTNGVCDCIVAKAKPTTLALLKRFNLVMRRTINGFELYSTSTNISSLLTYIEQTTDTAAFDFDLINENQYFTYFTDLSMNWMGQLHYDSQSQLNKQEAEYIELTPKLDDATYLPVFGDLSIHFEDLKKRLAASAPISYTINYTARNTQWQYYIINRSKVAIVNPKIIGKSAIEFIGPEKVTIETGEQALFFSSNQNLIPLSTNITHKFDLVDLLSADGQELIGSRKAKTIIKGLPAPKAERIGNIKNDIKLVSSPMYVYV